MDFLNDPLAWTGTAVIALGLGLLARRVVDTLDRIAVGVEDVRDELRRVHP